MRSSLTAGADRLRCSCARRSWEHSSCGCPLAGTCAPADSQAALLMLQIAEDISAKNLYLLDSGMRITGASFLQLLGLWHPK